MPESPAAEPAASTLDPLLGPFSEMASDLLGSRTVDDTTFFLIKYIKQLFHPESWSILIYKKKSHTLRFNYVAGPAAQQLWGKSFSADRGIAGWVVRNHTSLLVPDTAQDPRFDGSHDMATGFLTQSVVASPLKANGTVFGVVELLNTIGVTSPFSARDLQLLETLANFTALALERIFYTKTLRRIAYRDFLTAIPNRRAFEAQLGREIEMTRRFRTIFSLLVVDVNKFKTINDTWGHSSGDRVLRLVADVLEECTRKVDFLARFGGDEFVILLPNTGAAQAEVVVSRIHDTVARSPRNQWGFTLSVGLRVVDIEHPELIFDQADQQMYQRKTEGWEECDPLLEASIEAEWDSRND